MTTSVTFGSTAGDRQCINIPIFRDSDPEPTENFNVILNLPAPGRPEVVPGTPDIAIVNIIGKIPHYVDNAIKCNT